MSERFEKLYQLPDNLYSNNAPIIVVAGALLKDTISGNVIAQIKFHSVSENTIKALKIGLKVWDVSGQPLQSVNDYQYLDLNICNGMEFGSNKAIVMPDSVTRSFKISKITVVFADDYIWEKSIEMTSLPEPKLLQNVLENSELVKQYQLVTNSKAQYIPCEKEPLWMCSCGTWNITDKCSNCFAGKSVIFDMFNAQQLTERLRSRMEEEYMRAEEEKECKRIAAEKQARLFVKRIKIAVIAFVVCLIVTFSVYTIKNIVDIPVNRYNDAVELIENGNYQKARDILMSLEGYKDSDDLIKVCEIGILDNKYNQAMQLMKEEQYSKAISEFEYLYYYYGYKDSAEQIEKCKNYLLDTEYNDDSDDYTSTPKNYCEAGGCYNEGTRSYIGISGATEYYCSTHYNEMMDMIEAMEEDVYGSYDYDDDYGEGYGYDSSDPFYSSNDHNNDGYLTDEEWLDAMEDALDYYDSLY